MEHLARTEGPGARLPSESALAEQFSVSRATVRRALSDLTRLGLISTRRGQGSVVTARPAETPLARVEGFTDAMLRLGRHPETAVLRIVQEMAPANVAKTLGPSVWRIERLRSIDGAPAIVEWAHLPANQFRNLDQNDLTGSLYHLMDSKYGLAPIVGHEQISAAHADRELARLLDLPISAALLTSIRTSRTATGLPVEVTYRCVHPERCAYIVPLGGALLETVLT
jgi:GntR family transcriptional regulator